MPGRGCVGYLDLRGAQDLSRSVLRASLKADDARLIDMADVMEQYKERLSTLLQGSFLPHEASNHVLHEVKFGKSVVTLRQGRADDVKFGDMFDTPYSDLKERSLTDPFAWIGETERILRQKGDFCAHIFLIVARIGNPRLLSNLQKITVEDKSYHDRPFPFFDRIYWRTFKSALHDAFAERRSELIKALLEVDGGRWKTFNVAVEPDEDEPAVLDMAVESGDVGIIKLVLGWLRPTIHCYDEVAERSRFPGAEFDAVRGKPLDLLETFINRGDKETARSILQRLQSPVLIQALEQQPEDQIRFGEIKSRLWSLAVACDGVEYVREALRVKLRIGGGHRRGIETISKYMGWINEDESRLTQLILEACRKKETQVVYGLLRSASPSSLMTVDEDLWPLFRIALDMEDPSISNLLRPQVMNMLDMMVFNKSRFLETARALNAVQDLIIDAFCQEKPFLEIVYSLGLGTSSHETIGEDFDRPQENSNWHNDGRSGKLFAKLLAVVAHKVLRLELEGARLSTKTRVHESTTKENILDALHYFFDKFAPDSLSRNMKFAYAEPFWHMGVGVEGRARMRALYDSSGVSSGSYIVANANLMMLLDSMKELEVAFPIYEDGAVALEALPSDALAIEILHATLCHVKRFDKVR